MGSGVGRHLGVHTRQPPQGADPLVGRPGPLDQRLGLVGRSWEMSQRARSSLARAASPTAPNASRPATPERRSASTAAGSSPRAARIRPPQPVAVGGDVGGHDARRGPVTGSMSRSARSRSPACQGGQDHRGPQEAELVVEAHRGEHVREGLPRRCERPPRGPDARGPPPSCRCPDQDRRYWSSDVPVHRSRGLMARADPVASASHRPTALSMSRPPGSSMVCAG